MAFRLDSILNPSSPAPERNEPVATTYAAAEALTALSGGAPSLSPTYTPSHQSSAPPQRPYHSPTHPYGAEGRPGSSHGTYTGPGGYATMHGDEGRPGSGYGPHATPLEPSPPLERPPSFGNGLQQYHHGSKSPEEQRRESFAHQPEYATQLAPIKVFAQEDRRQSYGHDTSRMVPGHDNGDMNDVAQHREPDYVRNAPTTTQIRQPSPLRGDSIAEQAQQSIERRSSFTPQIKDDEQTMSPTTGMSKKQDLPNVDDETAKAIAAATNEHGTRGARAKPAGELATDLEPSPAPAPAPAPPKTKKAPPARVGTKKGVARKPSQKKRKLDDEEGRSMSPSAAPASSRPLPGASRASKPTFSNSNSNTDTPQPASSPSHASHTASPPPHFDEDEPEADDGSDTELYCICRQPDNHSWMIACDGGCDDWFHGKCVQMKEEEGELIDKYICPSCNRMGRGKTTWKPACRRQGCNMPAKITKEKQSKYCSEECGREFMREQLGMDERPNKKRKQNKSGVDEEEADADLGPRGGVLRPGDVKAMLEASKNVDEFRALGDGVLSPPATASPEKTTFDASSTSPTTGPTTNGDVQGQIPQPQPPSYTLTPTESKRIQDIATQQDNLTSKKVMLRDREKFVKMVVEQATTHAEKQGIKPKDVCGYDSRLAWSDHEFQSWREGKRGRDALRLGTLEPPAKQTNGDADGEHANNGHDADTKMEDVATTNGDDQPAEEAVGEPSFCTKKRCEQHRQWQKNELTGVRSDILDVGEESGRLGKEQKEIREQAYRRWKGEQGSKRPSSRGDERAEGWVEVV